MTKKYALTLSCCLFAIIVFAQSVHPKPVPQTPGPLKTLYKAFETPLEPAVPLINDANPVVTYSGAQYRNQEEIVASTYWDAQSYGCMSSRMYARPNGNPAASWIFTEEESNYTDRGTGYNVRDNGAWGNATSRIEAVRTGFPSIVVLGDGSEVAISHNTSILPYKLWMAKKAPGGNTWTESALPGPAGIRMLWPKVAVGGPDNMTIHVIGITAPTASNTGGVVYKGMNGHVLYYRSLDGGQTWDKQNIVIPGLDSTRYTAISADSYTIDASGNTVAVSVFQSRAWSDIRLFKSTDNGENWSDTAVRDFPDAVEGYISLPGNSYTVDDIGEVDTLKPNEMAILSNDGFGSILIDHSGEVHVWFGRMYVMDNVFTDSTYFIYPGTNGLMYWKESFGANNFQIIAGALDYDNDNSINITDLAQIAPYGGACISSFPVSGIDASGTIYVVYSAIHELYLTDNEFYRHLYLIKSTDGGETWGDPLEISKAPYVDEVTESFIECVYPSIQRNITDQVWVLYQQDLTPGTNVWGAHHGPTGNTMMWIGVDPTEIPTDVSDVAAEPVVMNISPNPANGDGILLNFNLESGGETLVQLIDIRGSVVQTVHAGALGAGPNQIRINTAGRADGVYFVRLQAGRQSGIKKIVLMNQP